MHIEGLIKLGFNTYEGTLEQYIPLIINLLSIEKL